MLSTPSSSASEASSSSSWIESLAGSSDFLDPSLLALTRAVFSSSGARMAV